MLDSEFGGCGLSMFRGGRFDPRQELDRRRQDTAAADQRRARLVERIKKGKSVLANDPGLPEPLLTVVPDLLLKFGSGTAKAPPLIAQALLSAAIRSAGRPVCVVLPDTTHVAALVAILGALERLPGDYEARRAEYIQHEMLPGRRVLSLADGLVYGVGERTNLRGEGGLFLHYLDAHNGRGSGRFVVPPADLFSYEPTERQRPAGRPGKQPAPPPLASFDLACGVRTFGNSNLVRNRFVLLGSKAGFERYLEDALPCVVDASGNTHALGRDLPWGGFTETGRLTVEGPRSGLGEPLVALSRDPLLLREACASKSSEKASRFVVSDNVDVVMRSIDIVERIGERQSFILLANARCREEALELKRRGWIVWEPQPWELGLDFAADAEAGNGLGRSIRSLAEEGVTNLSFSTAPSNPLAAAYASFCRAGDLLVLDDSRDEEELLAATMAIRSAFFGAASWLASPDNDDQTAHDANLRDVTENMRLIRRLAGNDAAEAVTEFLDRLSDHAGEIAERHVSAKGEILVDLVGDGGCDAIVAGHSRAAAATEKFLREYGSSVRCVTPAELQTLGAVENVVVTSSLAPEAFARIIDPWPARNVTFTGYAFETTVYRRRLKVRERARTSLAVAAAERTRLLGLAPERFGTKPPAEPDPVPPPADTVADETVASFESLAKPRKWDWSRRPVIDRVAAGYDTLPAIFCRFVGRSWATFTSEHRPVVLIGTPGEASVVRQIDMSDLKAGHRIIMRDMGERDAIRLVAEERCGADRYNELRRRAGLWRERLRSTGEDVEAVAEKLASVGVRRNFVTVRSWLKNPDVLGPRMRHDLDGIAEAFGSTSIAPGTWNLCWDAIEELRSLHVVAGGQLSRMLAAECRNQLIEPCGHEIPVHLALGMVWVLEVGHVDPKAEDWPVSGLNRLHWDEYGWRERLIGNVLAAQKAA